MIVNVMFSIREKNSSNKLIKIECIEVQVLTWLYRIVPKRKHHQYDLTELSNS